MTVGSPDGQSIVYWQINTEDVGKFPLVNNTDSLYPTASMIKVPVHVSRPRIV